MPMDSSRGAYSLDWAWWRDVGSQLRMGGPAKNNLQGFGPRCFDIPAREATHAWDDGVTLRFIRFVQASASLALLAAQDGL